MTDTTDMTLAFEVTGEPDQMFRRAASASVAIEPLYWPRRWRVRFMATTFVAVGLLFVGIGQGLGGVLIVYGFVCVWQFGTRAGLESRVRRMLRQRHPSVGQPSHIAVDSSGVRVTTATSDQRWDWSRVTSVVEHDGGLVVVVDKGTAIDLPPWVFTDDRERVLGQLEAWRGG